ncbi:MAG: hypothetical protein R3F40_05075 [Candidatus Competibacteraceae bacterium]
MGATLAESLLLAAAEMDEALAEQVLTEQEPEPAAVWAALRQATAGRICGGAAQSRRAAVAGWGGAAVAGSARAASSLAHDADGGEEWVAMDPTGPLAALAFKVQMWEGRRHVFARLYRGTLKAGDGGDSGRARCVRNGWRGCSRWTPITRRGWIR